MALRPEAPSQGRKVRDLQRVVSQLIFCDTILKVTSDKGAPYDLTKGVLVRDQAGRFKSPTGKRIKGELPQAEIAHATEEGLRYDTEFQSPLGSESLGRVIVRDNLTGRISTLTLALPTGSAEK